MKQIGILIYVLFFFISCNKNEVKILPFKADQIATIENLIQNCKLPNSYKQGFFKTLNNPNTNYLKLLKKNTETLGAHITINEIKKYEISNPVLFDMFTYNLGIENAATFLKILKLNVICLKKRSHNSKELEFLKSYNFQLPDIESLKCTIFTNESIYE